MILFSGIKRWVFKYAGKAKALVVRELHANAAPFKASLSLGLGILVGFSPFYGLHIVILLPLAILFRLNRPLALLAVSTTIPPFVPFWVAAGVFTGKMVIPLDTVKQLIAHPGEKFPLHHLEHSAECTYHFIVRFFPADFLEKFGPNSGHDIVALVAQWAIGSSVLAVVCAFATVIIAYPVLLRIDAARKKAKAAEGGAQQ